MSIILYHYTTEEGAKGILKDGAIKPSVRKGTGRTKDDALFGQGVYLTSLQPGIGKQIIALHNYDGNNKNVQKMIKSGKVNFAIKFTLDSEDSNLVKVAKDSNRDVWLYNGILKVDPDNEWVIEVESDERVILGTTSEIVPYISNW